VHDAGIEGSSGEEHDRRAEPGDGIERDRVHDAHSHLEVALGSLQIALGQGVDEDDRAVPEAVERDACVERLRAVPADPA